MKRFENLKHMKSFENSKHWNEGKTQPFPGSRYPTRITWEVRYHSKERLNYSGKPSHTSVMRFLKATHDRDTINATIAEYDRGGFIAMAYMIGPFFYEIHEELPLQRDTVAHQTYHYLHGGRFMQAFINKEFWTLKLHGQLVYNWRPVASTQDKINFQRMLEANK